MSKNRLEERLDELEHTIDIMANILLGVISLLEEDGEEDTSFLDLFWRGNIWQLKKSELN